MPPTGRRSRSTTQSSGFAAIGFTKSSRRVIEPVGEARGRGRSCPPSARRFERIPRLRTTGNGSRGGLGHPTPSMPREPMKSKVVLLGDGGVGKTSLVRRFVVDQYSDDYITTVGTKVSKRSLSLGSALSEVEMVMQIWDVLGEQILRAAGHSVKRIDLVTPPQEPVDRLIRVTDKIMTDFCYHMGGVETGMPIVKRQLGLAGLDVRAPAADAIHNLIERLAVVEQDFKGPEEVLSNRERRLEWLDGIDA